MSLDPIFKGDYYEYSFVKGGAPKNLAAAKAQELEKEVTETQAAQIELDKTAEEFKRLHAERH